MRIRAVTLIEILIVMALISFLYVVGFVGYESIRRYNIASETLRVTKQLLRNLKFQSYTLRAQLDENIYGVGVRIDRSQENHVIEPVKLNSPQRYLEYPEGSLPLQHVVAFGEDFERISLLPEFNVRIYDGRREINCAVFYIIFEVPYGKARFYCQAGGTLTRVSVGVLTITIGQLNNRFLYVSNISDIYMK